MEQRVATAEQIEYDLKETNSLLDTLYDELKQRDDALDVAATMVVQRDKEVEKLKLDLERSNRNNTPNSYTTTLVSTPKKIRWRRHQCCKTTDKEVEEDYSMLTPPKTAEVNGTLKKSADGMEEKQTPLRIYREDSNKVLRKASIESFVLDSPQLSDLSDNSFAESLNIESDPESPARDSSQDSPSLNIKQSHAGIPWPKSHSWTEHYIQNKLSLLPVHLDTNSLKYSHDDETLTTFGQDRSAVIQKQVKHVMMHLEREAGTPNIPSVENKMRKVKLGDQNEQRSEPVVSLSFGPSKIPTIGSRTPATRIPVLRHGLLTPDMDSPQFAHKTDAFQLNSNKKQASLPSGTSLPNLFMKTQPDFGYQTQTYH